jgi:hypothetical protein
MKCFKTIKLCKESEIKQIKAQKKRLWFPGTHCGPTMRGFITSEHLGSTVTLTLYMVVPSCAGDMLTTTPAL